MMDIWRAAEKKGRGLPMPGLNESVKTSRTPCII